MMTEVRVSVNGCTVVGKRQPASAAYPRELDVFSRIPFAEAPRFKLATLLDPPSSSTVQATDPGPVVDSPFESISAAESPLHLHIIRPATRPASGSGPLPVALYFHGGGFNFGGPLERDHASFVSWTGEGDALLTVAAEYRLGPLGFSAGDGQGELNLGLKDQRAAVEWVRRWIGAFGGDGDKLTLMGVSAGAHSIGHHMLTPEPMPFQRAIIESGSPTARSVLSSTHPRTLSQHAALTAPAKGKPLSSLPVAVLRSHGLTAWAANMSALTWPFQPVVEPPGTSRAVIPDTPLKLWEKKKSAGKAADISILTGFCSHEGADFVPKGKNTNEEFVRFFKTLIPSLTNADVQALEHLYADPDSDPASPYRVDAAEAPKKGRQFLRLSEAYAHYAYICPVLHTADTLARAGATVYVYEFAAVYGPDRAASHGCQVPAVAHDLSQLGELPGMVKVSREMTRRWGRFAAGRAIPEEEEGETAAGGGEVWWPKFRGVEAGGGEILVFGQGNDEMCLGKEEGVAVGRRKVSEREREVCQFWWERMGLSQGMGEER